MISLIIKSLELSIGVISGGIAGLVNFFLLTKVVSEITKDGKGLKGKTYLILLTSVRYACWYFNIKDVFDFCINSFDFAANCNGSYSSSWKRLRKRIVSKFNFVKFSEG